MSHRTIEALVVGAGQAGLAMSAQLGAAGVPHLVLERKRIAERWRSERWDGLVANGPAWHDRFPGLEFPGYDPEAFVPKDAIADAFEAFAKRIKAPVHCGVDVRSVRRNDHRPGFRVETSDGTIDATYVISATGSFQVPVMPSVVPDSAGITQIHSNAYRNPNQLPPGAVLVVGSGSSGSQIAAELLGAGRRTYLSVGPHERPPRRYRGLDYCWWLGVLGKWDIVAPPQGREHVTIAVSGAAGGRTVDFRQLAAEGITLVGKTETFDTGMLRFAPDLAHNIGEGDAYYLKVLDEADAFAERNGLTLPEDPEARMIAADPDCMTRPIRTLNLADAGIRSIIWATGYSTDYGWLQVDAFDDNGRPRHQRGISSEPGLYFIGLPWLSRRGSSFIWGVWHDAKFLADHIAVQQSYLAYAASHDSKTTDG